MLNALLRKSRLRGSFRRADQSLIRPSIHKRGAIGRTGYPASAKSFAYIISYPPIGHWLLTIASAPFLRTQKFVRHQLVDRPISTGWGKEVFRRWRVSMVWPVGLAAIATACRFRCFGPE
jgi:hypothetical protein